ncbi:transposase [Bacillus dakarensis]|uniref:transposase n=1 Tax=Robertmurraya dakarensis TaxID=1926278 RepID=UPI00301D846A
MMKILIITGSVVIPVIMVVLHRKDSKFQILFTIAAILSALLFGNIASIALYNIIKDDTVFMTNIHGLFLNPLFLLTGAYLGVYLLYSLILRAMNPVS